MNTAALLSKLHKLPQKAKNLPVSAANNVQLAQKQSISVPKLHGPAKCAAKLPFLLFNQ